jgi:pimeloyl-ACP methyl ester carboxylesterase
MEPNLHVFSASDGVQLRCAVIGEGPPIILCHGFPDHWRGWAPQIRRLSHRFKVIAPDGRGCGASDSAGELAGYRLEQLVDDVSQTIVSYCDGARPLLVGHDWGGVVAWAFAAHFPERLSGLAILSAPHPGILAEALASDPAQQAASAYMERLRAPGAAERLAADDFAILRPMLDNAAAKGWLTESEIQLHLTAWRRPEGLDGALNWYRANDLVREPGLAAKFGVPIEIATLLLWGAADTALLPHLAAQHHSVARDLTLRMFNGAGHWLQRERPEEVAKALLDFAERQMPAL